MDVYLLSILLIANYTGSVADISSTYAAAATACASTSTFPRSYTRLLRSRALHPRREREQEQRRKRRTGGSSPPPSVQFSMARPVQLSMAVDTLAQIESVCPIDSHRLSGARVTRWAWSHGSRTPLEGLAPKGRSPGPVPRANSAERRDPRERLVDLGAARLPGECDAEPEQRVRIIHRLQIHLHPA